MEEGKAVAGSRRSRVIACVWLEWLEEEVAQEEEKGEYKWPPAAAATVVIFFFTLMRFLQPAGRSTSCKKISIPSDHRFLEVTLE